MNTVHHGDCLEVMATMPEACIDSIVTDPPYGLSFMGKAWDHGVPGVPFWEAALRVAKPGAMLLAFGGTRTFHRLTCAIEDAGWEIRDCLMWLYGSGFPKSMDISKAMDKAAGVQREDKFEGSFTRHAGPTGNKRCDDCGKWLVSGSPCKCPRPQDDPQTDLAKQWHGWGTALKPAWEPIIMAMKPLAGTFAANAEAHGVAGLNIDGCRIESAGGRVRDGEASQERRYTTNGGTNFAMKPGPRGGAPEGRWPANVLLDEEAGAMLGEPARFFYCAKASKSEKGADNTHPTVKPLALMEYLCRLTATPTGGVVLDPFCGSGTTLLAAQNVGRDFIGIELNSEYVDLARARIAMPGDLWKESEALVEQPQ